MLPLIFLHGIKFRFIQIIIYMEKQVQKSNLSASVGFLLTLFNLVVSFGFAISSSTAWLLIFSSSTAALSLILCISGKANARRTGRGKVLSIIGIALNTVILIAALIFSIYLIATMQSSSQV